MAIPTYEDFMLPLLSAITDAQVHRLRDIYLPLAKQFSMTDEELTRKLPSDQQRVFHNRIGWARSYLKAAGLVSSPKRGFVTITELGRDVLKQNPSRIDELGIIEFRILLFLASKPYHAFSRANIAAAVSSEQNPVAEDTIDLHVASLLEQLGVFHDYVQAVPYIGYRFKA